MIPLREALPLYVTFRQALGTKLQEPARTLVDFVNFMDRERASFITTELALHWAMKPQGVQRATRSSVSEGRLPNCAWKISMLHSWVNFSITSKTSAATRRGHAIIA